MRKLSKEEIMTYVKGSGKYGILIFAFTLVTLIVAALFLEPDGDFVEM